MKTNRLLFCALALAVTVSALALPASAATAFPDIQSHWAKSYIEEMTDANMFKGYEDGTFKPENKLTTAEALALCARAVGLDENTSAEIADDYKEAVDDVLDGGQSWFYRGVRHLPGRGDPHRIRSEEPYPVRRAHQAHRQGGSGGLPDPRHAARPHVRAALPPTP